MTPAAAIAFLEEAARYFEKRPTNGEDAAHWSNVANAENCRKIAKMLSPAKPYDAARHADFHAGAA